MSLTSSLVGSFGSCSSGYVFFVITRGRGLTFTSAHVLVRAPVDGPSCQPTQRDHTQRSLCSHAPFGRVATACVSSPRDWAVSTGSHMQQDMVFYFGANTSRRTSSTCSDRLPLKPGVKHLAIIFPQKLLSSACSNACFTPRRAELQLKCPRWSVPMRQ